MNKNKIIKALPTVLFYAGMAGIFISECLVARDTLKAKEILDTDIMIPDGADEDKDGNVFIESKPKYALSIAKMTWKCFIPSFVSTTLTVGSLVASRRLTVREIAALSSAVASTAGLVGRYRKAILDRTNEETLSDIDREVASAEYKDAKPPKTITTGHLTTGECFNPNEDGEFIFFDPLTKVKFRSTKLIMNSARYYLNRNFSLGCAVPLEMFYNFAGVELPEEYRFMEWDAEKICEDGYVWIDIDYVRSEEPDPETGEQYYIIEYNFDPGEIEDGPYSYPLGNPLLTDGSYAV